MVRPGHVLTLGETMGVAVTPRGEAASVAATARLDTAGAESTVAIGLARLGVPVSWLGVVGEDELGVRIRRDLHAEGVHTPALRRVEGARTGFMLRELRSPGLTTVTYYRADSAGSQLSSEDVERAFAACEPALVHLTGITPALSESAAAAVDRAVHLAQETGAEVSMDVNLRRALPGFGRSVKVVRALLPRVDILFVGDDELDVVSDSTDPGEAARDLVARGIGEVVVKLGADGAQALAAGEEARATAQPVEVVDVVGAGDSFVAGYLAARAYGRSLAERLRWGTIAAAFTLGSPSDWQALPSRADLEAYDGGPRTRR